VKHHHPIVLHVVQSLRGGGAESFVRELVPRLRRRGIDARVLCAYGECRLTQAEVQAWIGTVYTQQREGVSKFRYLAQMSKLIRSVKPDIVHTHTHVGAFWGRAAAILARTQLIVHTEHISLESWSPLERAAARILNPQTDAFIAFSERSADVVRRRERIRSLEIIPNGIQVSPIPTDSMRQAARAKLCIDGGPLIIGLVANLHPHKNPSLVIEALGLLPEQARNAVRLAIFGDGPLRGDLQERARALGVDPLVHFYGFRTDLQDLLPGLDLAVSTSQREMMPISLLESMNAALPIISVPHSGALDLIVDKGTGIVLKSWDTVALAAAVDWARQNPQWRSNAGFSAYGRLKQNFDIETVADRYSTLYLKLLSTGALERRRLRRGNAYAF